MFILVNLDLFTTILGGWVGGWGWEKIENKVHLSPAEAEIWAELGNMKIIWCGPTRHFKLNKFEIIVKQV